MSVAFIYSFEQSFWKSCQTITQNLLETYNQILKKNECFHFNYNDEQTDFQKLELANKIFEARPATLIIVDHKPHIYQLVKFLENLYSKNNKLQRPEIIIHVFGDFTLYGEKWMKSETILKKYKVKFICASDKQVDLVSKFVKNTKAIFKLPFPVNSKQFYYSNTIRKKQRLINQISEEQVVFLYTGRLSLQKKVIELTIDFVHFLKVTNANAVLYLAGEFDDLGNPFTGIYYKNGEFCQRFLSILETIEPKYRKKIKYIGNLNSDELLNNYNLADFYISLSVHNDEDFGMSPAEAICTGLPSILTDWAGYSSFNLNDTNACTLIPTRIDKNQCKIDYDRVLLLKSLMISIKNIKNYRDNREGLAKISNNSFSISSNTTNLNNILKNKFYPFEGFTNLMPKLAKAFDKSTPPFLYSLTKNITTSSTELIDKHPYFQTTTHTVTQTTNGYTNLYKKIYESYLSK